MIVLDSTAGSGKQFFVCLLCEKSLGKRKILHQMHANEVAYVITEGRASPDAIAGEKKRPFGE